MEFSSGPEMDHESHSMDMGTEADDGAGMSHLHMMMMKMYFHFGLGDLFLWKDFMLDSPLRMWLVCGALFVSAIIIEAIDYKRSCLGCRCHLVAGGCCSCLECRQKCCSRKTRSSCELPIVEAECCRHVELGAGGQLANENKRPSGCLWLSANQLVSQQRAGSSSAVGSRPCPAVRLAQAILHAIRTALALALMLAAMTYNVCVIAAIVLGAGCGFLIFYRPTAGSQNICH